MKKNDKINPNKEVISEAVPYLVIILVVIIIRTFIATPIKVNGPSMETTLYDGNLMILNKLGAKVNGLKRFDIVVVKTNKTYIIKRIIGLPGESVAYIDGKLYIRNATSADRISDINAAIHDENSNVYAESDIITVHTPLLPDTVGIINKEAISKMKDGVILIGNARGELFDLEAIIEGMESEKIGSMFMDAFPGETGIIHEVHDTDIVKTEGMPWFRLKYLKSFVNFVQTPHMAFFTEEAAKQMAESGVEGIYECITKGSSRHEIPKAN